jgi:hypothetical protein
MAVTDRNNTLADILRNDYYSILIIFLFPLLVNLPSLVGWSSVKPIDFVSGIPAIHRAQLLRGSPWIDPNAGFNAQALGKLAADEWLRGRVPWWNYYSGVGLPLAAEMQPGAFFLPFVLLAHLRNGMILMKVILQILAGLGTFILLRKIGLMRLSAVAGAILYEFNGTFAVHASPIVNPVAFLPWLILGIECARQKSLAGLAGGWFTIAFSLAFSIYAGFPEIAYIDGLLAGVWSLWRIFTLSAEAKYSFIKKLVSGTIVGLLLSVPVVIPFVEFCTHSYLSGHSATRGFGPLLIGALPQHLFPWLYGSIFSYFDHANVVLISWSNVGGFLGTAQLATVVLGLFMVRKSGLSVILALWFVFSLAKTFGLPVIFALFDLIPLIRQTAFFRYSPPSWEFCGVVLCAVAINEISQGSLRSFRKFNFVAGLILALGIAVFSLYPGWTVVRDLYSQNGYAPFLWLSLAWGFGSIVVVAFCFILARKRPLAAAHSLTLLLAIDGIALFSVGSFSGLTSNHLLTDGVRYLQDHIGLDRFYTLGPISPNYGAYYGIASINHNYLPVAQRWVTYIRDHIDPYADPTRFTGNFARIDAKDPNQAEVLRENVAQYKEIGVRYVVSPHSENPFERISGLDLMDSGNEPFNLASDQTIGGQISGPQFAENKVTAVRITIGNFSGKSDGVLRIRLSADGYSVTGERSIQESEDNQPFTVLLNQPITFTSGQVRYEISHSGGTYPVALWLWPEKGGQQPYYNGNMGTSAFRPRTTTTILPFSNLPSGYAPKLGFIQTLEPGRERPQRVFESGGMDIYELSGVKPYFEVIKGNCDLKVENRSVVSVNCYSESELVRRELYYPGWRAYGAGKEIHIEPQLGIFQSIKISPGRYKITFWYTPTHARIIWLLFLLGVVWVIIDLAWTRLRN